VDGGTRDVAARFFKINDRWQPEACGLGQFWLGDVQQGARGATLSGSDRISNTYNGGGKWIELSIEADPIYQTILIAAEKAFWRAVKTGEPPALFDCEPPKPRIEAVRVVDMNASNSWAEFAGLFCETRTAHADLERAKSELKGLIPEDAKEAMGHGIRAKRSKSGAVTFDLVEMEVSHASIQWNRRRYRNGSSESPDRTHQPREGNGGDGLQ
jgi:hypothetical protein